MQRSQHALRVLLLAAFAGGLALAVIACADVTSSDALGSVRAAERFDAPQIATGIDRDRAPQLQVVAIRAAHRFVGGEGPRGWERAAQLASIVSAVLLALPLYLVALELYAGGTAWLGGVLFLSSPLMGYVIANVLSEGLFLLFWTWALWAAIRFLRDGRWAWLPLFVASAAGAASLRLDGAVLGAAFWIVAVMPWSWAPPVRLTRSWPLFLVATVVLLVMVSPLGAAPTLGRERAAADGPTAVAAGTGASGAWGETSSEFWRRSVTRMWKVTRNAVSLRYLPFAVLGLVLAWSGPAQARVWFFLGLVLASSLGLLVERRASLGDCTLRDAIVPAVLLILAAGHGLGWVARHARIEAVGPGGLAVIYQPGRLLWLALLGLMVVYPGFCVVATPGAAGGFAPYRAAAGWLRARGARPGQVLDLTGWTTFHDVPAVIPDPQANPWDGAPAPRWIVVRQGQKLGHTRRDVATSALVADSALVARFPGARHSEGLEVWIFDRATPRAPQIALGPAGRGEKTARSGDLRLLSTEKPSNVKH